MSVLQLLTHLMTSVLSLTSWQGALRSFHLTGCPYLRKTLLVPPKTTGTNLHTTLPAPAVTILMLCSPPRPAWPQTAPAPAALAPAHPTPSLLTVSAPVHFPWMPSCPRYVEETMGASTVRANLHRPAHSFSRLHLSPAPAPLPVTAQVKGAIAQNQISPFRDLPGHAAAWGTSEQSWTPETGYRVTFSSFMVLPQISHKMIYFFKKWSWPFSPWMTWNIHETA